MLAWAAAALTDPKRARGGVTLGLATALSLTIGLEMLLYLAVAGAFIVLMWIRDGDEARRLATYGASLAGGCAFGFLVFASEANRLAMCDALSPVWLSAMVVAGAIAVALAWLTPASPWARLGVAALGGAALAGAFALVWPHCLGRLEQAPPELDRLWLSKVREAMPIWRHGANTAALVLTLPVAGLIGYALMLWRNRRDPQRLMVWGALAALGALSTALLFWQTRAGPAAQLLSIAGATALLWAAGAWLMGIRDAVVRIALAARSAGDRHRRRQRPRHLVPRQAGDARPAGGQRRQRRLPDACARSPRSPGSSRGMVLTFVDLGPRLITVTPHNAITGPYHRNAAQILDVMRAWRGTADNARATVERYRVDYVLICPNLSESTIYRSEAPQGFYMQLVRQQVPQWLEPVPLPAGSPYRMWRVIR